MKRFSLLIFACILIVTTASSQQLPELTADKSVWPDEIFLAGTGVPDEAEITLSIEGIGDTIYGMPIDLMFAIDVSGSMQGLPLENAKDVARFICVFLDRTFNQSGLVAFNGTAMLLRELSYDHPGLIPYIDGLVGFGSTAMGDAINLAQSELTGPHHKEGNLQVILIISDGSSNRGADPLVAAENAKTSGTRIYALGIGDPIEEGILRTVVSEPDSENYWRKPDPSMYLEILDALHRLPIYLAARHPSIIERLNPDFDYVPGSFSIIPDSSAGRVSGWDVGDLDIGETWDVTFRVTASDTGLLPVEVLPTSRANYMNFAGGWVDVPFPQEYVRVRMGVGVEEGTFSPRDEANIFSLGPNPFHESCTISYSADGHSRVRVTVHDLAGRLTKTLLDEVPTAGMHSVFWRGDNNEGQQVASGAYVCTYESGDVTKSRVVLLVR